MNSNIQALEARKAELVAAQEAVLNAATEAKRNLTDAEEENFNNKTKEIGAIVNSISRYEAIDKEKLSASLPTSKMHIASEVKSTGKTFSDEYKNAFFNVIRDRRFTNAALGEGGTTDGGYLVPTIGPNGEITALAPNEASLRKLALVVTTQNDTKYAVQATKATAASKAESRASNHAFTQSAATFGQSTLTAYMSGGYSVITLELAQDVPQVSSFLAADLSRAVNNFEENVFVNGSGSGEPQGILAGGTAGLTAALSGSAGLDATGTLNSNYYGNAQWLMNRLTGIALRKKALTDNQFDPYFVSSNGVDYFHGFKVNYSAAMPVFVASPLVQGKIVFADFKTAMIIGDRNGSALQTVVDNITQLQNGLINIYGFRRTDSRVLVAEAAQVWTVNG